MPEDRSDRVGIEVEEREEGAPPSLKDLEAANESERAAEETGRGPGDPAAQPRPA